MTSILLYTILTLSLLGAILAVVLYFVAQRFKVTEDPRIDQVVAVLPGANCGACGSAGCRNFAELCVNSETLEKCFCPVGGNAVMQQVAAVLGKQASEQAPMVAVLRCGGSCDKRTRVNIYDGSKSCKVMDSVYGSDTGCSYGCLGLGDCVAACAFDAIKMDPVTGLPGINEEKCTSCGACVKACPKNILELRPKGPKNRRVYVACASRDKGADTRKVCSAGCIGCNLCVKACPFEAITVTDNLAYIDFNKCRLCRKCVEVCPVHCILEVNFPLKKESIQNE